MRFIRNFKLSDWCLEVIIDNLNFFIYNEIIPQKHIDFLFRLYSEEVYRRYSNMNSMTEERILWFLNPHNKKITLSRVSENVITRLQVVGSGITSLTLFESLASERMINSIVCCIPNVTYLDLRTSHCSDCTLLCTQRMCPNVVTLKISGCRAVTDYGMKYLAGNQSIRNLDILQCSIGYNGLLTVLQGIPFLQCLQFEGLTSVLYYIHKEDFITGTYKNISYNLTEFIMYMCDNPFQVTWAWTILCPNVKKVHFKFPVDNRVLEMCKNFQKLKELKIQMLPSLFVVADYLTPVLPIASNLQKLILSCVEIPIGTLLENFTNLKVLYLEHISFSDFKLETIKIQETKLETLAIKDTDAEFPHASYKALALLISVSKNVSKLYLNHLKNLSQELFEIIINSMKRLTFVDFSFSIIKSSSVNCFFKMPSLRKIYCDLCIDFPLNEDLAIKSTVSEDCCTLSWHILNDDIDEYNYDNLSDIIQ